MLDLEKVLRLVASVYLGHVNDKVIANLSLRNIEVNGFTLGQFRGHLVDSVLENVDKWSDSLRQRRAGLLSDVVKHLHDLLKQELKAGECL